MHPRTRELLDYLDANRRVLREAIDEVPPAKRDQSPAPGRWSAAGVVEHLAIVEQRVGAMLAPPIAQARADGGPPETATDPILPTLALTQVTDRSTRVHAPVTAHPTGAALVTAWASLEQAGVAIRNLLRDADGIALGQLTAPHPLFGPLSFSQWFAFLAAHEARHAAQIREDYGP